MTAKRIAYLAYGFVCYAIGMASLLYLAGFVGGFGTPTTLDGPATMAWPMALAIDLGLLMLFALQHSVMARPTFKKWWTKFVPQPIERATYCLASAAALFVLFAFWQPIGGHLWQVTDPAARGVLYGLYAFGWMAVVGTTFLINHFDLFGLRQVWLYAKGREYTHLPFRLPGPYKYVRHPLYVGWLTVMWATPSMTVPHLVFAVAMTAYILVAIRFEERNLIEHFGFVYKRYTNTVPMLIPSFGKKAGVQEGTAIETKLA